MFPKGMIGVKNASTKIQLGIDILSLAILILVLALSVRGRGLLKSDAVLIGMVVGSIVFMALFGSKLPQYLK